MMEAEKPPMGREQAGVPGVPVADLTQTPILRSREAMDGVVF